ADTKFLLVGKSTAVRESGSVPAIVAGLPIGEYEVTVEQPKESQMKTLLVVENVTNEVVFEFKYGAVVLETEPSGASVFDWDGHLLGTTPLSLEEQPVGWRKFRLERNEYASVAAELFVNPNQTSHLRTNFVSHRYVAAMRNAQESFGKGWYSGAVD